MGHKTSIDYAEESGLRHALQPFKVKRIRNEELTEEEKIVEKWILNRVKELEEK